MAYSRRSSFRSYGTRKSYTNYRPTRRESSERALAAKGQTTSDDDVLLILYRMTDDPAAKGRLHTLLHVYRNMYGDSAGDYIVTALPKWRSGTTKVATQTIDRLVNLVPRVLSDKERYSLLRKVYQETRPQFSENHKLTIILGLNTQEIMKQIDTLSTRLLHKPKGHNLPDYVKTRMSWVCNEDATLARKLMATIEAEETALIADAANLEVRRLISMIESGSNIAGTHIISYPYGSISITVRKATFFEKLYNFFS